MRRASLALLLGGLALAGCGGSRVNTAAPVATKAHGERSPHMRPASAVESPRVPATLDPVSYAEQVAGVSRFYAGVVDDPVDYTVRLNLVHAPRSIIDRLRAAYPDTYVIDNNAPRTWGRVLKLQRHLSRKALLAKGIDMIENNPTPNGHLRVGVTSSVSTAQAYFDRKYGPGVVLVSHAAPGMLVDAARRAS